MAQKEADAKAAMQESAKAPSSSTSSHMAPGSFQYQRFYKTELEKKHQDKWVSPIDGESRFMLMSQVVPVL